MRLGAVAKRHLKRGGEYPPIRRIFRGRQARPALSAVSGASLPCFEEERGSASLSLQGHALVAVARFAAPAPPTDTRPCPLSLRPRRAGRGHARRMTRCADQKGASTMTKSIATRDPHSRITDRILAELEQGTRPWLKPWSSGEMATAQTRPLRATGQPYRGINVLLLWIEAQEFGFVSPSWMTYRQAQALGAQVRKGEHGATVVYYGNSNKTVRDEASGEDREETFRFLKTYTVFNVAQIDGLPERFHSVPETAPEVERIERAEAFFDSILATVNHGGDRAYYMPSADRIQLPPFTAFHDAHGYYTTRGHETVHWTRHPSRLDRSFGREKWGDEGYAREELVAELGAAFLAADLGLAIEPRPDHASYLASWIKVLQNDTRAIVRAAAYAERAVAYLHQLAKTEALQAAA